MKRRENEAEIRVLPGNPRILGVYRAKNGYNFASVIPDEKEASLLLYEKNSGRLIQEIPLPPKERTGEVAAVFIEQFRPREMEYNYKIDGEIRQEAPGLHCSQAEKFSALLWITRIHTAFGAVCWRGNSCGKRKNGPQYLCQK